MQHQADYKPMTAAEVNRSADRLFWFCFLSYTCSYIGRKNLSACLPVMLAEGLLSKSEAGMITTVYMLVYGIGQLCSGVIGSRVRPQYLVGLGLTGAALCNLSMGLCPVATLFPLIWALNGACQSMLWAPIIRIFTDRLPRHKRDRAGVNIAASCSAGAILAFLLPALILRFAGWRVVFFVSGGILACAALIWVIGHRCLRGYIRIMDDTCAAERAALRAQHASMSGAPRRGMRLPTVIFASGLWLLLFALFCNGALRDAVETWAPTFLSEAFSLDGSIAALTSVIIPVVSLTGAYAADWVKKHWIANEIDAAALMFGITLLSIGGIFLLRETNALLCALLLAVSVSAMFGANHLFLTVVPYHFAPLGLSAAVTGFLNSAIYFATALGSGLYGLVAERWGWTVLILIWLAVSGGGILFSLMAGRIWRGTRERLANGQL